MAENVEWSFARGHCSACMAGTFTFVLLASIWGWMQFHPIDTALVPLVATVLGLVLASVGVAMITSIVLAPYSYLLFRMVVLARRSELAVFMATGIVCVALGCGTLAFVGWIAAQFQTASFEDNSPLAEVDDERTGLEFMTILVISGAVGGATFYRLGRKNPVGLSAGSKQ